MSGTYTAIAVLAFADLALMWLLFYARKRYARGLVESLQSRGLAESLQSAKDALALERLRASQLAMDLAYARNYKPVIQLPDRRHFNEGGFEIAEVLAWNACIDATLRLNRLNPSHGGMPPAGPPPQVRREPVRRIWDAPSHPHPHRVEPAASTPAPSDDGFLAGAALGALAHAAFSSPPPAPAAEPPAISSGGGGDYGGGGASGDWGSSASDSSSSSSDSGGSSSSGGSD